MPCRGYEDDEYYDWDEDPLEVYVLRRRWRKCLLSRSVGVGMMICY
jgi:hypothetical protein